MEHSIRDLFERVIAKAVMRYFTHGLLAAVRTLPVAGTCTVSPHTDTVRAHLLEEDRTTEWSTLTNGRRTPYTEEEFCLVSNPNVFRRAFVDAYGIAGRFNVDSFIKGLIHPWAPTPVFECFVLSKTQGNMAWHVDGGRKVASDLVLYMILGPADAVSCFMLLAIDNLKLLEAQVADPSFPNYEQIDTGLIKLDELNLSMEVPDLSGCEASFCGLLHRTELNGIKVEIIESYDDGKYLVQHLSGQTIGKQNKVHARNLQLASGYCALPDEINRIVPCLSSAVQTAVAAGVVSCYYIWGREGDVVVFDGSKPHGVWNCASTTGRPQLALAVNCRGVIPLVEKDMKERRGVRLKSVAF